MRSVTISGDKFQAAVAVKTGSTVYSKATTSFFGKMCPLAALLGKTNRPQIKKKSNSLFNLVLMLLTHIF